MRSSAVVASLISEGQLSVSAGFKKWYQVLCLFMLLLCAHQWLLRWQVISGGMLALSVTLWCLLFRNRLLGFLIVNGRFSQALWCSVVLYNVYRLQPSGALGVCSEAGGTWTFGSLLQQGQFGDFGGTYGLPGKGCPATVECALSSRTWLDVYF